MGGNLSRQTAEKLYRMIVAEGKLTPGDKLPNEMELSRELGVPQTELMKNGGASRLLAGRTKEEA